MRISTTLAALAFLCLQASAAPGQPQEESGSSLPVVDLGYELHQASFFNVRFPNPILRRISSRKATAEAVQIY